MASHRVGLFEVRQAGFLEEEVDLFNPAIGGSLAPAIDSHHPFARVPPFRHGVMVWRRAAATQLLLNLPRSAEPKDLDARGRVERTQEYGVGVDRHRDLSLL